jgi:hypothetical protein
VITAALIERLQVVDRLICVSPSASSNKVLLDRFSKILDPNDIFHNVNDEHVHDSVIKLIEKERDDWEEYLAKKNLYDQAMAKIRSTTPLFSISDDHLLQFHEGPPKYRGKTNATHPACILVWYDDVVGAGCMMGRGARRLANFALMHRHTGQLKAGGALGCSLLFNIQSYKTHGGLPKAIRSNLTLILLGKVTSAKDLQAIYEEMAGEVSEETFYSIYDSGQRSSPPPALQLQLVESTRETVLVSATYVGESVKGRAVEQPARERGRIASAWSDGDGVGSAKTFTS